MHFLYLYATTASSQDTSQREDFAELQFDEGSPFGRKPKKPAPQSSQRDGRDIGSPVFEKVHTYTLDGTIKSAFSDPGSDSLAENSNDPEVTAFSEGQERNLFFNFSEDPSPSPNIGLNAPGINSSASGSARESARESTRGSVRGVSSPFTRSSLYSPELERSLVSVVNHDEALAKQSVEPMLDIHDPFIDWGALYELRSFKNGSFSEWVYGVWDNSKNQFLYVIKSLKNHPLSKSRRVSIEAQLQLLPNELIKEIRKKAQLASPEKVFENFERLQREALPIFEAQNLFHVYLPVQLLRVPEEDEDLKYVEICRAAQGESLEDYVRSKAQTQSHKVEEALKIVGKRLALFHGKTGYIHGDLNLGNIFIKEDEQERIDLSFIDAHTMTSVDELLHKHLIRENKEEFRQSLFLEDVRNLVEFISRLSNSKIMSEALVHVYIDAFLLGYKEGYAEVLLNAKFEEIKDEIFNPSESIAEEA